MLPDIQFLYFDLGRVLLDFTHDRGFEQIAKAADIDVDQVKKVLQRDGLSDRYEMGELTTTEFHQQFCAATDSTISCEELCLKWSDIFEPIPGSFRIAASLKAAGNRVGILSNTCEAHWQFAAKSFPLLSQIFDPVITSYETKSMKPASGIYETAIKEANVGPANAFFVDDRLENVDGAKQLGWNAVQFVSPYQLANDLERLGVSFNR